MQRMQSRQPAQMLSSCLDGHRSENKRQQGCLQYNQIMQIDYTQQIVREQATKQAMYNLKKVKCSSIDSPCKKDRKIRKKNESLLRTQYSNIPQIPSIRLTKSQMEGDPVELLTWLQKQYQSFGAVKLITPDQWKPPFCFKMTDKGITTRIQHIHKLKYGKAFKQNQEAYNVGSFKNRAADFQTYYRFRYPPAKGTPAEQEEHEFWQLIKGKYNGPDWKFKVTTEYAADLPVQKYGSGFPLSQGLKTEDDNFDYYRSFYNLNNLYKSPFSILKIAEKKKQFISGVTTPWVYMGMMFSTFCWHVEDLWLNSLNYSHTGATKTWYVIPKQDKEKFDQYVKQKTGKQNLLNRITYMLDPLEIMQNGIRVYKANQQPGSYVCTFYKAYHCGFSHGFNVGEAVNFASPYSIDFMKQAIKYSVQRFENKPLLLPYEWIVYENMLNKNKYQQLTGIISSQYSAILQHQYKNLKKASKQYSLCMGPQIQQQSKYDCNSCSTCKNYQFLSSIRCRDCHKNYCYKDLVCCCGGNFEVILREPNCDRIKIKKLLAH